MRPGAPWIGVLLLLILVNPAAWATSNDHAVGKIEFEPPALVRGGNMSLMGGPGTYWAVYDVNASTVAEIDFKGTLEAGEVIAYDQEFIRTPPEDGYTSVPQTARLSRAAVEADSISFRLLAPLRNFSLVVNGLRGGAAQTGSGQFAAPVLNPYLLTAARHPAALQPEYGPYGWGPNFLELVAPGAYHHFKTSSMNATVNGTVAVWVGHSIVELTNSSGTRRFVLESRATPVAGPGPGAQIGRAHV